MTWIRVVTFAFTAVAQVAPCFHNSLTPWQGMIQKAAEIDDPDRKTDQEYADIHHEDVQTIRDRYAATGDFSCGGNHGQAQFTVKDDVITTSAHNIFKDDTCELLSEDLSKCS